MQTAELVEVTNFYLKPDFSQAIKLFLTFGLSFLGANINFQCKKKINFHLI